MRGAKVAHPCRGWPEAPPASLVEGLPPLRSIQFHQLPAAQPFVPPDVLPYNGSVSMFETEGFDRTRPLGKKHWVVTKVVPAKGR